MGRPRRLGHAVLMAVYLATAATARSSHNLFERQSTCPDSSQNHCSQSGLPSNFCCPAGETCIPLAGNTTLLCCPGTDCSTIKTIPCDISLQNVTLHPDNTLKTTALSASLPTCGSQCCPFGFTCNASGNCVMSADQTLAPGAAPSLSPSSTATSTSKPVSTSSSSSNSTTALTETCNKFPIPAILVGFFPGLLLGVILTLASICLLGAHRRKASRRRSGSSFGNISDPQPSEHVRTDFLRKPPPTPSSNGSAPSRRNTLQRVRSIFGKAPSSTAGSPPMPPAPPIPLNVRREQRPVTPVLQREPSYEDISIFTDGNTASSLREREVRNGLQAGVHDARASHQTTFSDMMERSGLAGLQKGQPYVYKGSPGYTPSPKNGK